MYSVYDKFARIYNKHWGDFFTGEAITVFDKFVPDRLPVNAAILDLCCGTVQMAKILSSRGYSVTGIDGSRQMLRFARKNAPNCKFILDDARTLDQGQSFDAAVSAFDSLNHITRLDELKSAFQHTYHALKGGGIFLFDLNTDQHFKKYWRGSFGIVGSDYTCVVRSRYDVKHKAARIDIAIFSLRKLSGTRSDLAIFERPYDAETVVSALRRAGFVRVGYYDSQEDLKLEEIGRTFFVGERSK